jgi:hypothetical protein
MNKHGEMIPTGETPGSFTIALCKSYQQIHPVGKQEKLGKKKNFVLRSISFILRRVIEHAVKSYDIGPTALLSL